MQSPDFLAGVLQPASAAFEPIRTNNAVLRILGLNTLSVGMGSLAGGASNALMLALSGFSLPKNQTTPSSIAYLNERRKFAGETIFDDVSVAFRDFVDAGIAKILWQWRYIIHDPTTGLRGLKVQYACNGEIEHFAPDGGASRFYTAEGIWPMSLDMGDIQMGSDEPVLLNVRFACDKIYPAKSNSGTFGTMVSKIMGSGSGSGPANTGSQTF